MSTNAVTITAAGTEFYIDDIVDVIIKRMIPDAEEDENTGVLRIHVTEDDLLDQAVDYANDNPTDLGSGTAFRRLGYGYEEDRSVGYASVYDVPKELAGDYELEVDWTVYGERVTSLKKVA